MAFYSHPQGTYFPDPIATWPVTFDVLAVLQYRPSEVRAVHLPPVHNTRPVPFCRAAPSFANILITEQHM